MFGNLFALFFPATAILVSLITMLVLPSGISDWQVLVIAFAAGGLVLQQRQIMKVMVTKEDLAQFELRMTHDFQTKEGCQNTHGGKGRGASAGN